MQDLGADRLSEGTEVDPRRQHRQAWRGFPSHRGRDFDVAKELFQERELRDLVKSDERTRVRYDRGHAPSAAFSS